MPVTNRPWEALAPGERWRGQWETRIAEMPPLPVLAARGKADGPVLLVTGGVHGDEYEGPAAIARLFQELERPLQRGMLQGLPVVHGAARAAHSRAGPVDGVDLNRAFPGSHEPDGISTPALAHAVFETFVR